MNCQCITNQRRLTPGVFNLKQYLNGAETMVWEVDNCVINDGTCNLADYDAFLTLSVGGGIDEIMLTKRQTDDKMQLIWDVAGYATSLTGYVKYQIAFRSAQFDTLGVIANDPEANGIYQLVDVNTFNTSRVFRKAENGYSIKWDAGNGRWALYKADGVTVVDYQTTPSQEPHCGVWDNIGVGNNEAAAWISDEAIMYISDSIAADQKITGNFPTILRQLWARISQSGVASVNKKTGIVELFPEDIGAAKEKHTHDYLPLAGGKMNGGIYQTSDAARFIIGGASSYNKGAHLTLNGKDGSLNPGSFEINAIGESSSRVLIGKPDGALTWGGKPLVLKVNGNYADANGNITAAQTGCLPLSGGTLSGSLTFSQYSHQIAISDTSRRIDVMASSDYFSAGWLSVFGKDFVDNRAGGFELGASDNNRFQGKTDGSLTWVGKNIVRSVNNTNADAAGNVTIAISNISGLKSSLDGKAPKEGQITAPIAIPSGADLNNYNQSAMGYYQCNADVVAQTVSNCPFNVAFALEVFCGCGTITYQRATRYADNVIKVRRLYNGTWSAWKNVLVFEGETPSWDGKNILTEETGLGYPNYAAGVDISGVETYTAPCDGWIYASRRRDDTYVGFYINGYIVAHGGGTGLDRTSCFAPIKKDQVFSIYKTDSREENKKETLTTSSYGDFMHFYPMA